MLLLSLSWCRDKDFRDGGCRVRGRTLRTLSFVSSGEVASDEICFWWPLLLMTLLLMTCLQELFFRSVTSDAVLQTHFFRRILPYASKLQIKFLCSWTCSIRIFMNSTLIMDHVQLNKLFSISNWWFLIPCYYQNSIGDFVKHPLFQHCPYSCKLGCCPKCSFNFVYVWIIVQSTCFGITHKTNYTKFLLGQSQLE